MFLDSDFFEVNVDFIVIKVIVLNRKWIVLVNEILSSLFIDEK